MPETAKKYVYLANGLVLLCILFVLFKVDSVEKKVYSSTDFIVNSAAEKIAAKCRTTQDIQDCYQNNFKDIINTYNFSFAEQTLYALQDIDEMTRSCHVLAHYISRYAVEKDPGNWLDLFDSVDVNACGSGFLHGVLESHLGDNPDTKFDGKLSEEVCNKGEDDYRKRMCTHFMGHFFIVQSLDNVAEAVPHCRDVSKYLQFDCLDGLFMEHNQKISLADHGIAEEPDFTPEYVKSLEDICRQYSGIEANACHTELAEIYAKTFGYKTEEVYKHCYKASTKEYAESCYRKGQTIMATFPIEQPKELNKICSYYRENRGYANCVENVISSLMYYSPKFTQRGLSFCESQATFKESCMRTLGARLKQIVQVPEERLAYCQGASNENYKKICAQVN